ncbi:MAG: archease [Dehalococcoidia bacterium]|nr:archease [Dehalococcoidia bacterium]
MVSRPFEFVAHTADVAALVRGRDLCDLLRNAAAALYCLALGSASVEAVERRQIEVSSIDDHALLVDWLNELIYLLSVERLVFSWFGFEHVGAGCLVAQCHGGRLPHSAKLQKEIKAATYHLASIVRNGDMLAVRIVFDV